MVAFEELAPLIAWVRNERRLILHAHSRLGIFASFMASLLTAKPLVIHLHGLASRPALYRLLWRFHRAKPVFNSSKTCRHYGCDPARSLILMPPMAWPKPAEERRAEVVRFVGCGALVPAKHFDLLVLAFHLLQHEGLEAELHIYGVSCEASDPACQNELIASTRNDPAIHLHAWDAQWTDHLAATDIFVHLGCPESFGLVILEAFARSCKLIVLPNTFLDDLPPPLNTRQIYVAEELSAEAVARQMRKAIAAEYEHGIWALRQQVSGLFSVPECRAALVRCYRSFYPAALRAEE